MGFLRIWVIGCTLAMVASGCDEEPTYLDAQTQGAVVGACAPALGVVFCTCADGMQSTQTCLPSSLTWGECLCGGVSQGSGGVAVGAGGSTGVGGGAGGELGGGGAQAVGGGGQQDTGGAGAVVDVERPTDGSLYDGTGAVVTAPFACGGGGSFGASPNVTIGGREVLIEYPCDHREGADMIFVLNLHGTMSNEAQKLYQHSYFSIHNHIASHNFIVAAPKATGSQWGRSGGNADEQHLKEVIAYVYDTFSQFNIQAMWIGGHSWGSMYTRTFVCEASFADRVQGAILMSGNSQVPACSDRLSLVGTLAESDLTSQNVQQSAIAGTHGCGSMQTDMVGNNVHDVWGDCSSGYVHANYLMLGKSHATSMDAEVVASIADEIRAANP